VQKRQRLAIEVFEVLGQPSAATEPRKGSFDDPASGQTRGILRIYNCAKVAASLWPIASASTAPNEQSKTSRFPIASAGIPKSPWRAGSAAE
jgi:hypothetical protein